MFLNNIAGAEGEVILLGARAVVGIMYKWNCERHGDGPSGEPRYRLRASLSFQKDTWLTNPRFPKNIRLKTGPEFWYLAIPENDSEIKVTDGQLFVDEVKLCREESPLRK